jgi:hypothetical protein
MAEMSRELNLNERSATSKTSLYSGSRTKGRPCSRWADNIDMNIWTIGDSNWKATAINREHWGRLLKKTMAHKRLLCQR